MAPEVHHYILKLSLLLGQMELIKMIEGKRGSISSALLMENISGCNWEWEHGTGAVGEGRDKDTRILFQGGKWALP